MSATVVSLVLVLAAAVAVTAGSSLWGRRTAERETEQLRAAATEVALLLSSLSTDSAAASLDRIGELSTGQLREEVTARRSEVLEIVDDDVTAHAEVIASGVERPVAPSGLFGDRAEPASALLLVATRAEVSNSLTDGDERTWRWRIEAVMSDGRALVSAAEIAV